MLPNRPYLLRAFYQWIVDSGCVPILVLNANHPRCNAPQDFAEDGEIVFNIAESAVRDLKITSESIEFKASFSGIVHIISAPIPAVLAIYAEENGEGIFFDGEEETTTTTTVQPLKQLKEVETIMADNIDALIPETVNVNKVKPVLRLIE